MKTYFNFYTYYSRKNKKYFCICLDLNIFKCSRNLENAIQLAKDELMMRIRLIKNSDGYFSFRKKYQAPFIQYIIKHIRSLYFSYNEIIFTLTFDIV